MLPAPISLLYIGFIGLTLATLVGFYFATGRPKWVLKFGSYWLFLAALLAYRGFFGVVDTLPPRLASLIAPMLAGGLFVGFSERMRFFRAGVSVEGLHYLHAARIIVEAVFLHGLFVAGVVARELTYEGLNYDIFPGIALPIIGLLVVRVGKLPRWVSTAANLLGIGVLGWTVVVAVLSTATSYQQFGVGSPTMAIFHFPWVWLPAIVAPLMFWSHFIVLGRYRDEGW